MTTDLETQLRQMMHSVAAAMVIPPAPRLGPAPRRIRHRLGRRLTAIIAAGGLGAIGVGAAAASGAFDEHAKTAFGGNDEVDLSRAVQIAAMTGPAGTTIRAFEAPARHGYSCIAFTMTGDPSYSGEQLGGGCSTEIPDGPSTADKQSGTSLDQIQLSVGGRPIIGVFAIPAFSATSAYVEASNERHPLIVSYGYIVGWLRECDYVNGTLIARNAAGEVVIHQEHFGATPYGLEGCPGD
jgi:hypothetical protein